MTNAIISSLHNASEKIKDFDIGMAAELNKIANLLPCEQTVKVSKLIEKDDIVVCVDNFNNLFKGRRYKVTISEIPGFIGVAELDGGDVGIFSLNRFVLDNNEQ